MRVLRTVPQVAIQAGPHRTGTRFAMDIVWCAIGREWVKPERCFIHRREFCLYQCGRQYLREKKGMRAEQI